MLPNPSTVRLGRSWIYWHIVSSGLYTLAGGGTGCVEGGGGGAAAGGAPLYLRTVRMSTCLAAATSASDLPCLFISTMMARSSWVICWPLRRGGILSEEREREIPGLLEVLSSPLPTYPPLSYANICLLLSSPPVFLLVLVYICSLSLVIFKNCEKHENNTGANKTRSTVTEVLL